MQWSALQWSKNRADTVYPRTGDWSQLPNHIWCFIGEKLSSGDQLRFRSVCKTWRSLLPFPQTPWLMLAQEENTRNIFFVKKKSPKTRGFFAIENGADEDQCRQVVQRVMLPEIRDKRCVGSTGTWLITVGADQGMCLLNPFSRHQIDLPPQPTEDNNHQYPKLSPKQLRDVWLKKAIISSCPLSSECIAMAIRQNSFKLAIARPGGTSWITVQTPVDYFDDIIFYKNQFYGINKGGVLVVCEIADHESLNLTRAVQLSNFGKRWSVEVKNYLVEWMGELLYVMKYMDLKFSSYKTDRFEVYMFDFTSKKWSVLKNLGDYSLFLGFNTSVAVLASMCSGLRRNCIFFTDDYAYGYFGMKIPGGRDMGVFDMEDGSIGLHYKGESTSLYSPPLWIIPSNSAITKS